MTALERHDAVAIAPIGRSLFSFSRPSASALRSMDFPRPGRRRLRAPPRKSAMVGYWRGRDGGRPMIHVSDSSARARHNVVLKLGAFPLMKSLALALVAPILLLAAASSAAGDNPRRDQDEARAAVERRDIRPLNQILAGLREKLPGEIVKVTLEREGGAWLYEFRLVDPQGRVREVSVDAATGAIVSDGGE